MERTEDIRNNHCFQLKKWILFTFCAIGTVLSVMFAVMASIGLDYYIYNLYPNEDQEWRQTIKDLVLFVLSVATVLSVFFNWVGLMGAYLEHYCMTLTYAVLIALETMFLILVSIEDCYYWVETALSIIMCFITHSYAYDLRQIKTLRRNSPQVVYINTAINTPTVVDILSDAPTPSQSNVGEKTILSETNHRYQQSCLVAVEEGCWSPPPYTEETINH